MDIYSSPLSVLFSTLKSVNLKSGDVTLTPVTKYISSTIEGYISKL